MTTALLPDNLQGTLKNHSHFHATCVAKNDGASLPRTGALNFSRLPSACGFQASSFMMASETSPMEGLPSTESTLVPPPRPLK